MQPRVITKRNKQTRNIPFSHSLGEPFSGKEATEERTPSWNLRIQVPLPMRPSEKCVYVPFSVPLPHNPPYPSIPAQGRGRPADTKLSVYGVVCVPPTPPPRGHNAPSAPCALPPSPPPLKCTCQAAIGYWLRTAPSYWGSRGF